MPSSLPLASVLPSGLNATLLTQSVCPVRGHFVLPCDGVPQPHRIVVTPTGNRATIWTIRYTINRGRMPREYRFFFTRDSVPTIEPCRRNPHRQSCYHPGLYATLLTRICLLNINFSSLVTASHNRVCPVSIAFSLPVTASHNRTVSS